jgi:hypothetical protein
MLTWNPIWCSVAKLMLWNLLGPTKSKRNVNFRGCGPMLCRIMLKSVITNCYEAWWTNPHPHILPPHVIYKKMKLYKQCTRLMHKEWCTPRAMRRKLFMQSTFTLNVVSKIIGPQHFCFRDTSARKVPKRYTI